MTLECTTYVRIAEHLAPTVRKLRQQSEAALRRSAKLPPGDRSEIRRYEGLQTAIERCAVVSLWAGEPNCSGADGVKAAQTWESYGAEIVELRLPHMEGETEFTGVAGTGPPLPLSVWRSESDLPHKAMAERFRQLLEAALSADATGDAVVRPSGVTNSVLTETLREFVYRSPEEAMTALPVRYRDGSNGPSFPFRAVSLVDVAPPGFRRLRFTLLSIRHVEMDCEVDGAWLRNAKVSRPRLAGLTDQLVYETSLRQLRTLTERGPITIDMYQTGLETAVVGFYRAVTRHLIERPGTLAVSPHYFRGPGRFSMGSLWATK